MSSRTHSYDGDVRLYFMTAKGWSFWEAEKLWVARKVPREVQAIYIAEGWTRIFYQELFGSAPLVYPQIEGRP